MLLVSAMFLAPVVRGQDAAPSESEALIQALVDAGFENVQVQTGEGLVTVWYENRVFRNEMTAMGVVGLLAVPRVPPDATLELVPRNRGVPLLSVSAPASAWGGFLEGRDSADRFRAALVVRLGARANGAVLTAPPARNLPYLRADLALRPLYSFRLGIAEDTYLYTLQAAPEGTMSPFYGGLVTAQVGFRIHDDLDPCGSEDPCGAAVKPVRNTLSWGGWLPKQWLLAASAGTFPGDRYGLLTQAGRLFLDGQLEVLAGGELTGRLQFLDSVVQYSDLAQWTAYAAATYRTRGIDLEATLTGGRFREGEMGVRVDVQRRLGEFEVGFFGVVNEHDDVGGITLRVALPVRHYLRPSRVRLTTVPEFPLTYRESVASVAVQTSMYDSLDRLRKRLYPTYIRNNVEILRTGTRYVEISPGDR
jgi:hypothetical protein